MIQIPLTDTEKRAVARLFTTSEGQGVLSILEENTIKKPVIQTVLPDSGNTLMVAAQREGQNSVIRQIQRLIEDLNKKAKEAN
tara:strand:+ start:579 stop:827 length:249 start_codon:yes stop_codon:yes gene_type:complete